MQSPIDTSFLVNLAFDAENELAKIINFMIENENTLSKEEYAYCNSYVATLEDIVDEADEFNAEALPYVK